MVGLFDCRRVGPSTDQVGDAVPRFVFHCFPHKPSFHIVSGDSGLGKTGYALNLARSTDSVFLRVDDYFYDLELHKNTNRSESAFGALKACFNQFRDGKPLNVGALVNHLVEQGHAEALADMLLSIVSKDYDYVLEGYIPGEVLGHLRAKLAREGWKVWESGVAPVVK